MSHIPYGYRIENGKAVIDEKAAEQVRTLFDAYLSGDSMKAAAGKAGIKSFHAGIGRMLTNAHYLGDGFYPAIIDADTFAAAEAERAQRVKKLNRIQKPKEPEKAVFPTSFCMREGTEKFDDPFEQAEYAYNLIEPEAETDGGQ